MRMGRLLSILVMALVMPSSAFSKTWSSPAVQRAYFAQVREISDGLVQPFKDENGPAFVDQNAIFEVDLEGNGSRYIASYGKANANIVSLPPGVEISHLLASKPIRPIRKGQVVILILNSQKRKLTILPEGPGMDMSVIIRPVRWKGKDRYIPSEATACTLPRDRDAILFGDSGTEVFIYYRKRWAIRYCPQE